MSDQVPAPAVHPHSRIVGHWRIGQQQKLITRGQTIHATGALAEDGAMDRGEEAIGSLRRERRLRIGICHAGNITAGPWRGRRVISRPT